MFKRNATLAIGLLAASAVVLAGCSTGSSADSPESGVDAATATSVADFGTFADLEAAAIAEGALNVIALPRDWANYGEVIDLFKATYPEITVTEAAPDASSAEEIEAAKTNAGLDTAPDVFDLGLAVTLANTDQFAPYKVQTWDEIPDALKEQSGLYVGDYGGFMSVGFDSAKFPAPESIEDLLGDEFRGSVAMNGDPTQAGAAFAAVGLATVQTGGTLDDFSNGIDFFSQLNAAGNLLKLDVTTATIASGETPVVFNWDYLNATNVASNPDWEVVVFPGAGYAAYYNQAINIEAPHPAAARLWQEYPYSDEAEGWRSPGSCRRDGCGRHARHGPVGSPSRRARRDPHPERRAVRSCRRAARRDLGDRGQLTADQDSNHMTVTSS